MEFGDKLDKIMRENKITNNALAQILEEEYSYKIST